MFPFPKITNYFFFQTNSLEHGMKNLSPPDMGNIEQLLSIYKDKFSIRSPTNVDMVYHPSWVIQCQIHPSGRIAVVLLDPLHRGKWVHAFLQVYKSESKCDNVNEIRILLQRCHSPAR